MIKILKRIHIKIYIALFFVASGILYLKVLSPALGISIPCIFRKITGLYCPGCGVTRASLAILDGDVYQSFRYNMLIFILVPLLILFYVLEKKGKENYSQFLMGGMLVITVVFGVLRNLEAFSWLAPIII